MGRITQVAGTTAGHCRGDFAKRMTGDFKVVIAGCRDGSSPRVLSQSAGIGIDGADGIVA
jgi:hypothetical protein